MAVNKRKILESARKLAQKGAKDKALREYQKLLKLDPKDAKLRLEIGDAHRRWGQVDEAIDTYTRVAEQYMAEGFDARAVAVYKQIVNLDPDCLEAYAPLAELYERMGLSAEAIGALQTAADGFHRQGKKAEALGLLRKMANADPTNTTSRIKVADLLRQESMTEEAIAEYTLAAEELERQADVEMVGNVYRRVLELDEKHVGALSALAQNLATRGKLAESLPLAERALTLDLATPERYESLAALYEQAGREEDRVGVYRKLSDLYRERGDENTARNIMQRFVPTEDLGGGQEPAEADDELSGDPLLDAEGGDLFGEEFAGDENASEPSLDFGNDERLDVAPLQPGMTDASEAEPETDLSFDEMVGGEEISLDEALDEADDASSQPEVFDVEQLLAEASVYLRYGKRDRAVAHLERVLQSEPEHRPALEKLGDIFAEAGEAERAVEVWLRAAKRASEEDDQQALRVLKSRIAALDPNAAANILPGAGDPAPEPPLASDPSDDIDLDLGVLGDDLALDSEDEELLDDEILDGDLSTPSVPVADDELSLEAPAEEPPAISLEEVAPAPSPAGASASAGLSATTARQVQDDLEEADFYVEQGLLDEAEEIYQRVLALAPNHPKALLRLGEVVAARGGSPAAVDQAGASADETPRGVGLDSPTLPDEFLVEDEVSSPDLRPGLELSEDEVEEARESLSIEIPEDDEGVVAEDLGELSDLDLEPETAEEAAAPDADGSDTEEFEVQQQAETEAGGEFDLAAALADAFDDDTDTEAGVGSGAPESDGFEAVFGAFKKGVSEALSEGDHQAHYDLAIAYKEMGLHDDAIAELELTMADPSRTVECTHLIALCALDADRAPLAVEHLERLLALPDLAEEAALAGRFDLGRALSVVGNIERAREVWTEVAKARAGFQDVEQRLAQLDAPPSEADDSDAEAGFESFEDVLEAVFEDDDEVPDSDSGDGEPASAESAPAPSPEADVEPDPPTPTGRKKRKVSFV